MTLSLSMTNGPPEMLLKYWMARILGAFLFTVLGVHFMEVVREISLALYWCVSPPRFTSFNTLKSSTFKGCANQWSLEGLYRIPVPEKKRFNLLIRSKVTRAIGSVSHNFMRNSIKNSSSLAFPEESYIAQRLLFYSSGDLVFLFMFYKSFP